MSRFSFLKLRVGILFLAISLTGTATHAKSPGFKKSYSGKEKTDKVVISGIIKDENGNPVENAKIVFDTTAVSVTDKTGSYSFELTTIAPTGHTIYFSCDGFSTVVRTYYPVMLSTSFNITLRKLFDKPTLPAKEIIAPVIRDTVHAARATIQKVASEPGKKLNQVTSTPPVRIVKKDSTVAVIKEEKPSLETGVPLDFPSILYKPNETILSGMNKAFLDIVAGKLKSYPAIKIDIRSYVPINNSNSLIAQTRLTNIVKYMVEKKGIAADRLNKKIIPGGGDVDIIDIENSKQE